MQEIFLKVLSMGVNASWMILAVLLWRVLFWKSPKWITCFLWVLVGIRLLCPWNIESVVSLVPVRIESTLGYSQQDVNGGNQKIADVLKNNDSITNGRTESVKNVSKSSNGDKAGSSSFVQNKYPFLGKINKRIALNSAVIKALMVVWLCGAVGISSYFLVSFIYVSRKVETATLLRENIWESEFVDSPFVFGCIRPKIYVPYGMSQEQLFYSLAHEQAHLKRKDHIVKLVAFFILALYWFQPFVWIAYSFMSKDMELACDERAVIHMDKEERKNYLLTLLSCSVAKKSANIYPLAFGKIGIKERVIRMKKWKRPSFLVRTAILSVGLIVALCFFTSPKGQKINLVNAQEESKQEDKKAVKTLKVKEASVDLSQSTGADGTMLYYVDEDKIIFGGYFGLFVYDKASESIVQSLDLEYIGCNQTQGDNYCEILVDQGGQNVYLSPMQQEKGYQWNLTSNELKVNDNSDTGLVVFNVENTKEVTYENAKKEKIRCTLDEKDFTIGNCTYRESKNGETEEKEYKLFSNYK